MPQVSIAAAITAGNTAVSINETGDLLSDYDDEGSDLLVGSNRNDALGGGGGRDILIGGGGNDLIGGDSFFRAVGPAWEDYVDQDGVVQHRDWRSVDWQVLRTLTPNADGTQTPTFEVTNFERVDMALGDADQIYAGTGDDGIFGGLGDDFIDAGAGNDIAYGEEGSDTLLGQAGDDVLVGDGATAADGTPLDNGSDFIDGGEGNDKILGGGAADVLYGGAGNDSNFDCLLAA